jgi:hypothetical protein
MGGHSFARGRTSDGGNGALRVRTPAPRPSRHHTGRWRIHRRASGHRRSGSARRERRRARRGSSDRRPAPGRDRAGAEEDDTGPSASILLVGQNVRDHDEHRELWPAQAADDLGPHRRRSRSIGRGRPGGRPARQVGPCRQARHGDVLQRSEGRVLDPDRWPSPGRVHTTVDATPPRGRLGRRLPSACRNGSASNTPSSPICIGVSRSPTQALRGLGTGHEVVRSRALRS